MKDYEEVARDVLSRRDEYRKTSKKRRVRTGRILVIAAAVTLIAAFTVTLPLFHRTEEPLTEPFWPEDTTDADVRENPKPTYSSMREFAEEIERYAAEGEEVSSESGFQLAPGIDLSKSRDLRSSLRTLDAPTLTLRESGVTWSAATGYETIFSTESGSESVEKIVS